VNLVPLIEFRAENYRSIQDEVTLSLLASSDKSLPENLIEIDILGKDKLVRSGAIFGANASGKTNVLLAINELKRLVISSHLQQKGEMIPYEPFKLDKQSINLPTKFEIIFIKNNIKYFYNVSYTNKAIIKECLYYYPKGKRALVFKRYDTNTYHFTVDKKTQKTISEKTPENILYLSRATQFNYDKTAPVFEWLKEDLITMGPTDRPFLEEFTIQMLEKPEMKKILLDMLRVADLSITDVVGRLKPIDLENIPKNIQNLLRTSNGDKEGKTLEIKTYHKGTEFDFYKEESEGTIRFFSIISHWIDVLKNGKVLIVDELDTKLHHLLIIYLITLFHTDSFKEKAQLIFTTHNSNLLDQSLFRRDQIWFTEKDPEKENTELFSLLEFRPRKDKNIQLGYLTGRYGAIPFIEDYRLLDS